MPWTFKKSGLDGAARLNDRVIDPDGGTRHLLLRLGSLELFLIFEL